MHIYVYTYALWVNDDIYANDLTCIGWICCLTPPQVFYLIHCDISIPRLDIWIISKRIKTRIISTFKWRHTIHHYFHVRVYVLIKYFTYERIRPRNIIIVITPLIFTRNLHWLHDIEWRKLFCMKLFLICNLNR